MLDNVYEDSEFQMEEVVENYKHSLLKIRTGKASPALLDGIQVEVYGAKTPINQCAKIGVPDPRLLVIDPWDKNNIPAIEKAVLAANIGITPANDGRVIRLPIPSLTEERRKEMVKTLKSNTEHYKHTIRNIRRDANAKIKSLEKDSQISEDHSKDGIDTIQKMTDKYIDTISKVAKQKEDELMQV